MNKRHPNGCLSFFGEPVGIHAASQLKPLAGLIQAGFDHRLLERSPDVLAYADALPGSNPYYWFDKSKTAPFRCCFTFGEPVGIRTLDTRLRRPLLYPAELRAHAFKKWSGRRDSNSRPSPWQGDALPLSHFRIFSWSREMDSNHRKLS